MRTQRTATTVLALMLAAFASTTLSGSGEGIKVSGHWVIEVLNQDGTLASRVEFDNHLNTTVAAGGADMLAKVLLGHYAFGIWSVRLTGLTTPPCPGGIGPSGDCWIVPSGSPAGISGIGISRTLTAVLGSSMGEVVLAGSTQVLATGQATIDQVATHLTACGLPSDCPNTPNNPTGSRTGWLFTEQTLGGANPVQPQTVQPGQFVQVTVRIRFS